MRRRVCTTNPLSATLEMVPVIPIHEIFAEFATVACHSSAAVRLTPRWIWRVFEEGASSIGKDCALQYSRADDADADTPHCVTYDKLVWS